VDILHVCAGTTGGWKAIDDALNLALAEIGTSVKRIAMPRRGNGLVRRSGHPLNDLYEAAAMATATSRALREVSPRAIIYSSSHAALLQPRRRMPEAVWVDGPIALMSPGLRAAPVRALERLRQHRLDLVLPMSLQHPDLLAEPLRPRATAVLHMPVDPSDPDVAPPGEIRPPYGAMYAGVPGKKGLDIAIEAWELAAPQVRLVVTGITRADAERYVGHRPPERIVFTGRIARDQHRAIVRRASVYVSASRREEYGTAQLEAMADRVPLAAVPSLGAVEPVAVARRLTPDLVASDISASALASSIRRALSMAPEARAEYSKAAGAIMGEYSFGAFKQRLRDDVLPLLLG
jgi:glycosyltransferase involved in cell wall biosynthesis